MEEKNSILGEKNVNFGGKKSILGENVNFKVKSQFWEKKVNSGRGMKV